MHKKVIVSIISLCVFLDNHKGFLSTSSTIPIPNSLFEALSKIEWRLAMEYEMDALQQKKTWEFVDFFLFELDNMFQSLVAMPKTC